MIRKALAGYRFLQAVLDREDARAELNRIVMNCDDVAHLIRKTLKPFEVRERAARAAYLEAMGEA